MLTPKYRENVKIIFVMFVVALMLFTGPALGKKARSQSGKSSRGSQKTQQVKKSTAVPKVKRPSNIGKTRTKVTAVPRSAKPRAKPSTSKPPGQITSRRTIKSSFRQTSRRAPSRHTITGSKTTFNTSGSVRRSLSVSKPFGSSFGGKRLTGRSYRIRRSVVISSDKRISSDKTSSIANLIREKKPAVTTVEKVTRARGPEVRTAKAVEDSSSEILRKPKAAAKELGESTETGRKRIGRTIKAGEKMRFDAARKTTRAGKAGIRTAETGQSNNSRVLRESKSIVKRPERSDKAGQKSYKARGQAGSRANSRTSFRGRSLFTRPAWEKSQHIRPAGERSQHFTIGSRRVFVRSKPTVSRPGKIIGGRRRHFLATDATSTVTYRERTDVVEHIRRHEHVYIDQHHRIRRRIVWPRYRFAVYYNWGPHFAFRYFYPYYHRRYVFVSLGGYWPVGYRYIRYYWYGCHPYRWYGYYPIAREVRDDTYNYYTYNYYNGETVASQSYRSTSGIELVDHTTFADVRERLAQEAAGEPGEMSLADRFFEDAVEAFEAGDYDLAAEVFTKAIELAPDDMILPFAFCQALFAGEKYMEAAEVLRTALAKVSPEKEGVFYPRGLYAKDDTLFEQIDQLAEKAGLYSFDGDLQLLLGYQLLGIGEIDEAVEPLWLAGQDLQNASSAAVLLGLLEKIRIQNPDDTD